MPHTLTLDFTVSVPAGPAFLYDVEGEAEVATYGSDGEWEIVAVSLDTLTLPPGQRFGRRYVPVEIGRWKAGKIDAPSPFAEALTRAIADALLKDDVFCAAVDDAVREARADARRDAAEARAEERREMAATYGRES